MTRHGIGTTAPRPPALQAESRRLIKNRAKLIDADPRNPSRSIESLMVAAKGAAIRDPENLSWPSSSN